VVLEHMVTGAGMGRIQVRSLLVRGKNGQKISTSTRRHLRTTYIPDFEVPQVVF